MSRPMTSDVLAAIQAGNLLPALFVTATFTSGPLYVWTGLGPYTWGGHTWIGAGKFGGISPIEESGDVQARGVTLTLTGIDPDLLTDVLTEFQLKAPVTIYVGFFDPSTLALISSPLVAWAGQLGKPTINADAKTATISIECENRLVDLNISVQRRYTHQDQQLRCPGDMGFSFVNGIQERVIYWGTKPSNSVNV